MAEPRLRHEVRGSGQHSDVIPGFMPGTHRAAGVAFAMWTAQAIAFRMRGEMGPGDPRNKSEGRQAP